jgi:hypothetical protein
VSDPTSAASEGLQFDKAEPPPGQPASPIAACAACARPLSSIYYQVNGSAACERCKTQLQYDQMSASGFGNVVRACALGFVAALAGGALWYAVRSTTGYEVGLIAILVGVMVGAAVRAGCRRRGGIGYQLLAVALTYFGICVQYVPDIIKAIREQQPAKQAEVASTTSPAAALPVAAVPVAAVPVAAVPVAAGAPAEAPATPTDAAPHATHSLGVQLLVAIGFLLAFAMAAPFLGGFENIIGILIIGFALWEAWKINRRVPLQIEGPFRLASPVATAVAS